MNKHAKQAMVAAALAFAITMLFRRARMPSTLTAMPPATPPSPPAVLTSANTASNFM